jgi:molybdopterin/thiamine biosynthesis adenylyltransferase/rhodanese-related sulfurtransferase
MDDYRTRLIAAKARVKEVEAEDLDTDAVTLIDVREPYELAIGRLPGALSLPMSQFGARIREVAPGPDTPIVLYCAVGERSAVAAAALEDAGYTNVASLAGGIKRWMGLGMMTESDNRLTGPDRHRYARHIALPQVGVEGQRRLLDAKVLIVGAGGLGSPAALYLGAAGIGTIGLVDDDVVELSNLQRQILHGTTDEGTPKAASGAHRILEINPHIEVNPHEARLSAENALAILSGYDIIVDGTDNFATRYLINDASLHVGVPVVHGSVFRFEGQVAVFQPNETACYRCVFPAPPPPNLAPSCAEAGVFGVLPGVIGTLQATEVLKLILGIGEPLLGKLLTYDALSQTTHTVRLERNADCASCGLGTPPPLREEAQYC